MKEFKKLNDEMESKLVRKEKQNNISQMWVVKAKNFLTEKPMVTLTNKKVLEPLGKDLPIKPKPVSSKDTKLEQSAKDQATLANSKPNLMTSVGTTDLQIFEGKRARIAREKATLTTICQLLKTNQDILPKTISKRQDDTIFTQPRKGDPRFSNKSISFSQRSCEVTASHITKQFSKAIFNTNLN
jgi:hypothetical protein